MIECIQPPQQGYKRQQTLEMSLQRLGIRTKSLDTLNKPR
jgi:hypothetical protein